MISHGLGELMKLAKKTKRAMVLSALCFVRRPLVSVKRRDRPVQSPSARHGGWMSHIGVRRRTSDRFDDHICISTSVRFLLKTNSTLCGLTRMITTYSHRKLIIQFL